MTGPTPRSSEKMPPKHFGDAIFSLNVFSNGLSKENHFVVLSVSNDFLMLLSQVFYSKKS